MSTILPVWPKLWCPVIYYVKQNTVSTHTFNIQLSSVSMLWWYHDVLGGALDENCHRIKLIGLKYFVLLQTTSQITVRCLFTSNQPHGCTLSCYRPPATWLYFVLLQTTSHMAVHFCTLSCYRPPATWLYFVLLQATSYMAVLCLVTGHQPHPCTLSCYRPPVTWLYSVLLQATSHIIVVCLATGHQPHRCISSCYRPSATLLYLIQVLIDLL